MLRSPSVARVVQADPRAVSKQRQKSIREAHTQQRAVQNERRQNARLKWKLNDQENVSTSLGKILADTDRSN